MCIFRYTDRARPHVACRRAEAAHTLFMFVTAAVFQSAIGPYSAAAVFELAYHALAAVLKFASVMAVSAVTCTGSARSSARLARRCDRHKTAQLHRKRDDVLQRKSTCCNPGCAAPSVVQRRAPTKLQH
jgi:hypothetical protein